MESGIGLDVEQRRVPVSGEPAPRRGIGPGKRTRAGESSPEGNPSDGASPSRADGMAAGAGRVVDDWEMTPGLASALGLGAPGDSDGAPEGAARVQRKAVSMPSWASASQVQARGDLHGENTVAIAERGVASASSPLPHLDAIQRSFGKHDVSDVRAQIGGEAADASRAIGAEAYATGNRVAFARSPDLHTAAHEAAHVVQQRAGVTLVGRVGIAGDPYEQQADAVADRVVQGLPAHDLLPISSQNSTSVQQRTVQPYTKVAGMPYDRLADDGRLAVKDHDRFGWAELDLIEKSNVILDRQHSKVRIAPLSAGGLYVAPPKVGAAAAGEKKHLTKFWIEDRKSHDKAYLPDDCGAANQQIMGSEYHGKQEFVAASRNGEYQEYTASEGYHVDDGRAGGDLSTTEVLSGQIYVHIFEREFGKKLSRPDALKAWAQLSASDKDRFGKKYGINKYAVPAVGQGVTIGSERDMPGSDGEGYNFHFAYNLMMSGNDYITLEDYRNSRVAYYLDMYGPESKGQSFAQDFNNTAAVDSISTTMVVEHAGMLERVALADGAFLVDDVDALSHMRLLRMGDRITIQSKGKEWSRVVVMSGAQSGQVGWIENLFISEG